jgi:hypothetical protein
MPKFCIGSVGDGDEGEGRNKGILAHMPMFCFGTGDGKSVCFMQKSWRVSVKMGHVHRINFQAL